MPQSIAVQEGVILIIDKDTGEPVAMVRKNGHIMWFTLKEATWDDIVQLTEANKSTL